MRTMRMMKRGLVTIPRAIRQQTNIAEGDAVVVTVRGNVIEIRRQAAGLRALCNLVDLPPAVVDAQLAKMRGKTRINRRAKR